VKNRYGFVITLLTLGFVFSGAVSAQEDAQTLDWRDIPFRDVLTGETIRISDFEGKPIILESFAVWCPTCKSQQDQILRLHQSVGDDVISISIDVDPYEDAALIRDHATRNGFNWIYAVAPPELTRALVQEFGTSIVSAPSAPIVIICEDQHEAQLLRRGVKRVDALLEAIDGDCST